MPTLQASALAANDWELSGEPDPKPGCLIVQLRRHAHVLPWFRFVYAEGDNSQVTLVFATHGITVTGNGLAVLLAALSTQRVLRILQPTENEAKFGVRGTPAAKHSGPAITDITVEKFK